MAVLKYSAYSFSSAVEIRRGVKQPPHPPGSGRNFAGAGGNSVRRTKSSGRRIRNVPDETRMINRGEKKATGQIPRPSFPIAGSGVANPPCGNFGIGKVNHENSEGSRAIDRTSGASRSVGRIRKIAEFITRSIYCEKVRPWRKRAHRIKIVSVSAGDGVRSKGTMRRISE